jgi:hypothetical protein
MAIVGDVFHEKRRGPASGALTSALGFLGVAATVVSLWLVGRLRIVEADHATGMAESLAAAAQGSLDADEPITVAEI